MKLTAERRLAAVTLAGITVLVAAVCVFRPGTTAWLPSCPFHALTGLYCPGCGSTRMLYFLVHGHPWLALQQNAMTLLFLPFALVALARPWVRPVPVQPGSEARRRLRPLWSAGVAALLIVFTVARNVPAEPFCKLAPGGVCARVGRADSARRQRVLHMLSFFLSRHPERSEVPALEGISVFAHTPTMPAG